MKSISLSIAAVLLTVSAWAAPVAKFTGNVELTPLKMHKDAIKGAVTLMFEGDNFVQLKLKTEKPVMGKTDFVSSEQSIFSKVDGDKAVVGVIWKLAGAPHKWNYTFVAESADKGKSFAGNIFKAVESVDDIKKILDSGALPATWSKEGTGTLTPAAQ